MVDSVPIRPNPRIKDLLQWLLNRVPIVVWTLSRHQDMWTLYDNCHEMDRLPHYLRSPQITNPWYYIFSSRLMKKSSWWEEGEILMIQIISILLSNYYGSLNYWSLRNQECLPQIKDESLTGGYRSCGNGQPKFSRRTLGCWSSCTSGRHA